MTTSAAKAVLVGIMALVVLGCSNRHAQFDGMVPAAATSVQYTDQTGGGNGVTFHVTSAPNSYQYVDTVRRNLSASGYSLCAKSAIAQWTPQPVDSQSVEKSGFWINEMYSTKGYDKFFLIRVDSIPTANGKAWNQRFTIAAQTIVEGKQNMPSIKEFCG
jgi:hypothetical protein